MDTINTAALPASFALAESVCCSLEILLIAASSAVLSNSMINKRRTDPIIKIRTIIEQLVNKFYHEVMRYHYIFQ